MNRRIPNGTKDEKAVCFSNSIINASLIIVLTLLSTSNLLLPDCKPVPSNINLYFILYSLVIKKYDYQKTRSKVNEFMEVFEENYFRYISVLPPSITSHP